jgi:hypothetical protein
MPRKSLLNVKQYLRYVEETCEDMLRRHAMGDGARGGLFLPPIDAANLNEVRFFAKAILRRHAEKNTRKDVYVNR